MSEVQCNEENKNIIKTTSWLLKGNEKFVLEKMPVA